MSLYRHLASSDRFVIYHLRRAGLTLAEIAVQIGVHKSTVSREISRNSGRRGYRPLQAERLALSRRSVSHPRYSQERWNQVEKLLHFDLSPEQAHNRLEQEIGEAPSHTAIYDYVFDDKLNGGKLHKHLRCRKKRRTRHGRPDMRGTIPGRTSISERPAIVERRARIGDWEADLMIGKDHKGAVVNLTERRTRLTLLSSVANKESLQVSEAIISRMSPFKDLTHTITNDNGKEFADHQRIANELGAQVYFSDPNAAWQRGTCENQNGLLRQYFPKNRRLHKLDEQELSRAEYRLNHRPRKCLGWKTPYEVFYNTSMSIFDVALRT